jgi:hypothetical protein
MKNYEKPIAFADENYAEGIFMASGEGSDCYTVSATRTQTPRTGFERYVFQVNAQHHADPTHTTNEQELVITFNYPVTYYSSGGTYLAGNGTNTLHIKYSNFHNASDNFGVGDVSVTSDEPANLAVTSIYLLCGGNGTLHSH